MADRLGVLQGPEPSFHALKPCQIQVTCPAIPSSSRSGRFPTLSVGVNQPAYAHDRLKPLSGLSRLVLSINSITLHGG